MGCVNHIYLNHIYLVASQLMSYVGGRNLYSTHQSYLLIAVNVIVVMETYARKWTKKPLRRHAGKLNTSLPVTMVLANKAPGMHAFKRSVTARAAM